MKKSALGKALGNLMGGEGLQATALLGSLMGNLRKGTGRPGTDVSFVHKVIRHLNHGDQMTSCVCTGANASVSGPQLGGLRPAARFRRPLTSMDTLKKRRHIGWRRLCRRRSTS